MVKHLDIILVRTQTHTFCWSFKSDIELLPVLVSVGRQQAANKGCVTLLNGVSTLEGKKALIGTYCCH